MTTFSGTIGWLPSPTALAGPIICFNTDCSYPFGPTCSQCQRALSKSTSAMPPNPPSDPILTQQTKEVSTATPSLTHNLKKSPPKIDHTSSEYMHTWLANLLATTIAYQMLDQDFIGGAEEEDLLDKCAYISECELCGVSVAESEKEWHFLQCKYAHDERERLGRFQRRRG